MRRRACVRLALAVLAGAALAVDGAHAAQADAPHASAPSWQLHRSAEGLTLSARVPFELPAPLADAAWRGVPLHFVWRAELRRPRWYWTDQQLASAVRVVRVVFQPLTQRWRLSVHDGPVASDGALAPGLHRTIDTLPEALALVSTVQRWRVAPPAAWQGDERLAVEFRIDTGQLPRPLQLLPLAAHDAAVLWRAVLPMAAATTADGPPGGSPADE